MLDYSTRPPTTSENILMVDGLQRLTKYWPAGTSPTILTWTARPIVKSAADAGLVVEDNPGFYYYRMSQLGANVLRQWIDAGFSDKDIGAFGNNLPELRIPVAPEWQGERWEVARDDGDTAIGMGYSYCYYLIRPDGIILNCDRDFKDIYADITTTQDVYHLADLEAIQGNRTGDIVSVKQLNKHWNRA